MSNGNRIIGAAIGLAALLFAQLAFSQNPEPKNSDSQNEKQDNNACVSSMAGSSFTLNCARQESGGSADDKRRNEREELDLIAQQSVAQSTERILQWTRVQIGISIFGILGLMWTLFETRRSIRVTREIGEAQVRAYMGQEDIDFVWGDNNARTFNVLFKWVNKGQSPAQNCVIYTDYIIQDFGSAEAYIATFSDLPPSGKIGTFCPVGASLTGDGQTIDKHHRVDFYNREKRLVLYSAIVYTDVFNKKFVTAACHVAVFPDEREPDKVRFRTYSHHNGHKEIKQSGV